MQAIRRIIDTGNIPAHPGGYRKRLGEPKAGSNEVNVFLEDIVRGRANITSTINIEEEPPAGIPVEVFP